MKLRELSWRAVQELDPDVAVLPVGSTEQHGPHNPVGLDAIVANETAAEATERTETLLLPSVEVGVAEHHRRFPGTLYVRPETLRRYVTDVVRSVAYHGIEKVVVVSGHGGNAGVLSDVCGRVSREGTAYAVMWQWMDAFPDEVDHAGKSETSFLLHLRPELVGEPVVGDADEWGRHVHGASVAHYTHEFTENGVEGDAREASAEHGAALFENCVAELVSLVEWVRAADWDAEALESFIPDPE